MHFIISISLSTLVFMAGVFLLLKVRKDNLGWFFKLAAYKSMVAGMIFIIATLCMGICKLAHCGGASCSSKSNIECHGISACSGATQEAGCKQKKACCTKEKGKKCHSEAAEKSHCKYTGADCKNGCQCEDDCSCEHCAEKKKDESN